MFQLTQRGPPELRSNSRRMQSILQARMWDVQSIFGFRCEQPGLCSPAKGDPHEGHLRPEMVSLVPPDPRRVIIVPKGEAFVSSFRRPQSAILFS